ncbi:DUF3618 domain-containing protein [Streptomyces durbertensis]|uniref:DUF3618 domain-containing protein n=1 Tax=Streptomyces durbertensis TaxID=2448886 RepID=A0ABR6EGP4_9ACTN|nr:DUF3618 domain-containing protein [Streptomyces durbertensis]MBB1244501.1 DUF3618 domain-containing protein [Streptomyces durbertensis]
MTQPPHDEPTADSVAELREQVEQTRRELGETVGSLAAKADVKARVQEKAGHVQEKAGRIWEEKAPEPVRRRAEQSVRTARQKPWPLLAVAGAAILWLAWRRRRG